jgi:hypothetical protein
MQAFILEPFSPGMVLVVALWNAFQYLAAKGIVACCCYPINGIQQGSARNIIQDSMVISFKLQPVLLPMLLPAPGPDYAQTLRIQCDVH